MEDSDVLNVLAEMERQQNAREQLFGTFKHIRELITRVTSARKELNDLTGSIRDTKEELRRVNEQTTNELDSLASDRARAQRDHDEEIAVLTDERMKAQKELDALRDTIRIEKSKANDELKSVREEVSSARHDLENVQNELAALRERLGVHA